MKKRIVTLGELMIRLSPPGYTRFLQAESFGITFGGAKADVAVALSSLGMDAAYVTKLPEHEIGQMAVGSLRKYGVDTSRVVRGGSRIGAYYVEKGASQRPGKVIYDRAGSAFATAAREDFDWDAILEGADWFHFSGITPALGEGATAICLDALEAARRHGVTVSCDINYRSKLWSPEAALLTMERLLPYVDYCKDLFRFGGEAPDDFEIGMLTEWMTRDFGLRGIAMTKRVSRSANDHRLSGVFYTGGKSYTSREYEMHLVDRLGGGDAFTAGWIFSLLEGATPEEAVEFATAAGCLGHSIEGDYLLASVEEVRALAHGDGSGRVNR